jgi:hypothetical protein
MSNPAFEGQNRTEQIKATNQTGDEPKVVCMAAFNENSAAAKKKGFWEG